MEYTEDKILAKYEQLICELTEDCNEFWVDDIKQKMRLTLLKQIRNSQDRLNNNIIYKKLITVRNRSIRKNKLGGITWAPTNPKTINCVSIEGDPELSNTFYSN